MAVLALAPTASPTIGTTTTDVAVVDAAWLAARRGIVTVLDVRPMDAFARTRLAGAVSLPLAGVRVEDTSGRALERLARVVQRALDARGIGPGTSIVCVDDADGSASFAAALALLAGVRDVAVVLGGDADWRGAWEPDEGAVAAESFAEDRFADASINMSNLATIDQLVAGVESDAVTVLDVRSQLEHEGMVGSPCCARRGALPGSVHVEFTAFGGLEPGQIDVEHVRSVAAHFGLGVDDDVIATCHAGRRAATALHLLRAAGFHRARLSLGSWHEWTGRRLP